MVRRPGNPRTEVAPRGAVMVRVPGYTAFVANEVQRIPPAPRRVSWRKVLGYRWPLAVATFVLLIYGGVMTWMFFLNNSSTVEDAARLASGTRVPVDGVVLVAQPPATGDLPVEHQRIEYSFHADGHQWEGHGETRHSALHERSAIAVEYLAGVPSLSRIVGAEVITRAPWFDPRDAFTLLVLPGLVVGLGYLAGVFHLRRVLAHGDVGLAQVELVRRVRFCLPESFAVRFTFRDHHARSRRGYHWVRAHSALGQRLLTMLRHGTHEKVPVLHDRRFPQHSRLVLPDDFSPDARPIDPAATIRL